MSYEGDRSTLGTEFATNWSTTVVAWPNTEFTRPQPAGDVSAPAAYVGFDVEYPRPQEQISFGGTERRYGNVVHGIFAERAGGDAKVLELADDIQTTWEGASLSGVQLFPKDCHLEDALSDGTWIGRRFTVPFWGVEDGGTITGPPSPTNTVNTQVFTQVGHGFSALDAVYLTSGGTWAKAQAATSNTNLADAIVTNVSGDQFWASMDGISYVASHGLGSAGDLLWLSQSTAGAITTTEPSSGFIQYLGKVVDADRFLTKIKPVGVA